jgi:hypothetical protein
MMVVVILTNTTGGSLLRNDIWLFLCLAVLAHRIADSMKQEAEAGEAALAQG